MRPPLVISDAERERRQRQKRERKAARLARIREQKMREWSGRDPVQTAGKRLRVYHGSRGRMPAPPERDAGEIWDDDGQVSDDDSDWHGWIQ